VQQEKRILKKFNNIYNNLVDLNSKNKLYFFVFILSGIGYTWLFLNIYFKKLKSGSTVCILKSTTGIPCPSCGTTRSLGSIIDLNLYSAFIINPLGYVIAVSLVLFPLWILFDLIFRKESFFLFYVFFIKTILSRKISMFLIVLILFNWIWNIFKGI
jgi:hypothetical protein